MSSVDARGDVRRKPKGCSNPKSLPLRLVPPLSAASAAFSLPPRRRGYRPISCRTRFIYCNVLSLRRPSAGLLATSLVVFSKFACTPSCIAFTSSVSDRRHGTKSGARIKYRSASAKAVFVSLSFCCREEASTRALFSPRRASFSPRSNLCHPFLCPCRVSACSSRLNSLSPLAL